MTGLSENKRPGSDGNRSGPWSNHPEKEIDMNEVERSTSGGGRPAATPMISDDLDRPVDDVSRARSIILTVWMALKSQDFVENGGADATFLAETLYEAFERTSRAQRTMEMQS